MRLLRILSVALLSLLFPLAGLSVPSETSSMPLSQKSLGKMFGNDFKEFRSLTVNDGFTRNSIFDIFQDKAGFIWFGSWDGVYRYDGSQLKRVYKTHKKDSKARQVVTEILEDDHAHIWVGTSRGIAIWDADDERLFPLSDIVESKVTDETYVKSLCKDDDGNIWIVTRADLYVFNQNDQRLTNVSYLFPKKTEFVNRIYADAEHHVWLLTNSFGIYEIVKSAPADSAYAAGHKWKLKDSPMFHKFKNTNVKGMLQDSQHNYWLALVRGIVHLNKEHPSDFRFQKDSDAFFTSSEGKNINITGFAEGDGCVYATTNKGLFVYSLKYNEHLWVLPDYSEPGSLTDKNLQDVMVDREGGLWIGSFYGGVNYLAPTSGNFSLHVQINKSLPGHVVSGIAEDCNGNIWFAVEDGGVACWNRETGKVQAYTVTSNTDYRPARTNVQCIYADDKNVYVGTFGGGVDIIDVATMKHFNLNPKKHSKKSLPMSIYSFFKFTDRILLMGGIDGLYYLDLHTRQSNKVPEVKGKVNCIIRDNLDDIWISTIYNGIYKYECRTKKWHHFTHDVGDSTTLVCNDINTMVAVNSSIFLGTQGNGLWEYMKNENKFRPIASDVLGDALIFSILPYYDTFWLTTNKGLFSYNRVTQQILQFTSQDGLRSNLFKENSGLVTSDGLYIVGGVNGVNCFHPSRLKLTLRKPDVILTELSLFNKPVDMQMEDAPLKKSISFSDHLEINQKHNNISFRFSSSSHNDPHKNLYQYMLDPFDKHWQRTTQQNNIATYTNLPAGRYKFKVRTSNGIGAWSDVESLELVVHPFWWRSLPMKIFYGIVLLLLVSWFVRRAHLKKKEEMRLFRFEKEQEMYHSKMEFFTCMVHEIRTPLTLILGPLSTIMKKSGRIEDVRPELRIIERNGNRLLSLVNQLMDFRKVEEQSYTVQLGEVDLKDLVAQITNEFQLYRVNKPVAIDVKLPEEPCWASIDNEAFTKILGNLLSNAMKFTKDSIEVGIEEVKNEKAWNVYVRDNGCGIAQKDQSSIFDSFYQVHQDMPSDYIGTGIGLFVVRRLLELQGGSISLVSKLNEGSSFIAKVKRVDPPAEPEQTGDAAEQVVKSTENEESNRSSDHKRLLVVEDNEEMRNYIVSLLSEKFQVDSCANGKEALDQTAANDYDLVITDLMMPVMDGMKLCKILKSQSMTSHIPVIILTAKDDESSQKEGFESEADLYVTKPFSADVLMSQVKSIIHNRERLRQMFYSEPEATREVLCTNNADKEFLEKFEALISQRLESTDLSVDELAGEMALGRSVFYQKVKGVTGLTPNDYIRTFRLKKAATLLQNGETRINEVCYRVGFSSPSYFTKRFTMQFGISPSDYLKKLEK